MKTKSTKLTLPVLLTIGLLRTATIASAAPLYEETFNGGPATSSGPLSDLGWFQWGATYSGYYNNAVQWINSATLQPLNTTNGVYMGQHRSINLHYLALYTTDTAGSGTFGLVSYSDITFSGRLTFSIFTQLQGDTTGDTITGRFLVQNNGVWYASALSVPPPTSQNGPANYYDPRSLTLDGSATNWITVVGLGTGTFGLGGGATRDLTGAITGVGFLEGLIDPNHNSSGWNYADFAIAEAPAPTQLPTRVYIDPTATYLLVTNETTANATPIDLASLGIFPGDLVGLTTLGSFFFTHQDTIPVNGMSGVFSSNSILLAPNLLNRVSGAIAAGGTPFVSQNTYRGDVPTDIPQDFRIFSTNTTLRVPPGAAFLFVSAEDDLFYDNVSNATNLFSVLIARETETIMTAVFPPDDQSIRVSWNTDSNQLYQVQYSLSLSNDWTNVGLPIQGTGGTVGITNAAVGQSAMFYRVVRVP
jgi:hypothetical protein